MFEEARRGKRDSPPLGVRLPHRRAADGGGRGAGHRLSFDPYVRGELIVTVLGLVGGAPGETPRAGGGGERKMTRGRMGEVEVWRAISMVWRYAADPDSCEC